MSGERIRRLGGAVSGSLKTAAGHYSEPAITQKRDMDGILRVGLLAYESWPPGGGGPNLPPGPPKGGRGCVALYLSMMPLCMVCRVENHVSSYATRHLPADLRPAA